MVCKSIEPKRANLFLDELRAALPQLERRIGELQGLDPGNETIDDRGSWRHQVAREMKVAGIDIDMNKLL